MSQLDRLIEFLTKNGSITTQQARTLKFNSLSAMIYKLKSRGYEFTINRYHKKTKNNANAKYCHYILKSRPFPLDTSFKGM